MTTAAPGTPRRLLLIAWSLNSTKAPAARTSVLSVSCVATALGRTTALLLEVVCMVPPLMLPAKTEASTVTP